MRHPHYLCQSMLASHLAAYPRSGASSCLSETLNTDRLLDTGKLSGCLLQLKHAVHECQRVAMLGVRLYDEPGSLHTTPVVSTPHEQGGTSSDSCA